MRDSLVRLPCSQPRAITNLSVRLCLLFVTVLTALERPEAARVWQREKELMAPRRRGEIARIWMPGTTAHMSQGPCAVTEDLSVARRPQRLQKANDFSRLRPSSLVHGLAQVIPYGQTLTVPPRP